MGEVLVHVTRDGVVESRHQASLAIADVAGRLLAEGGSPERLAFWRSAAKPVQLLPLAAAGGVAHFRLTESELAVMAASHSGETIHIRAVQSILQKIGLGEEHLRCGAHPPMDKPAAAALVKAGEMPRAIHCNCSGKHAALLALAVLRHWPTSGYMAPDHPVQQEIMQTVAAMSGIPASVIHLGVDGCGVPTYLLSLQAMATAYARLAGPTHIPADLAAAAEVVTTAMRRYPHMTGGTGRLGTSLMAATGGRIIAKSGAEGVFCVGWPACGLGLAMKIDDGAARAVAPLVIEILYRMGALTGEEVGSLADLRRPEVRSFAGRSVGSLEVEIPESLAEDLMHLRAG